MKTFLCLTAFTLIPLLSSAAEVAPPSTFVISPAEYLAMRERVLQTPEPWMKPALDSLRTEAEKVMTKGPWSVTTKKDNQLPPSKDKHDFYSLSIYFWKKPDGTWEWRDGQRNPDAVTEDEAGLDALFGAVKVLSNAAWFLGDHKYGERAALLLRYWFTDSATGMNPNMNYAAGIPGQADGRGVGIHRFKDFAIILDDIGLLRAMGYWTDEDQAKMVKWVSEFSNWCNTTKLGLDEKKAPNNHSVFYGSMMLGCACYTGNQPLIEEYSKSFFQAQLINQIQPNGCLPEEMGRTRPVNYTLYCLMGFAMYAEQARNLGIDYYYYTGPNGQTLKAAFSYALPFWEGKVPWPKKEEPIYDYRVFIPARVAAIRYQDPAFENYLESSFPNWNQDYRNLLWPPPVFPTKTDTVQAK